MRCVECPVSSAWPRDCSVTVASDCLELQSIPRHLHHAHDTPSNVTVVYVSANVSVAHGSFRPLTMCLSAARLCGRGLSARISCGPDSVRSVRTSTWQPAQYHRCEDALQRPGC